MAVLAVLALVTVASSVNELTRKVFKVVGEIAISSSMATISCEEFANLIFQIWSLHHFVRRRFESLALFGCVELVLLMVVEVPSHLFLVEILLVSVFVWSHHILWSFFEMLLLLIVEARFVLLLHLILPASVIESLLVLAKLPSLALEVIWLLVVIFEAASSFGWLILCDLLAYTIMLGCKNIRTRFHVLFDNFFSRILSIVVSI